MASNIGIKIANGEFYPIMEENSSIKKRIILTTVHDNQPSVQIDLYRSPANTMPDAQYIGSLVVENIKPKPKGEPSIEMVIASDSSGEIVAEAVDLDTGAGGEHCVLTVSLKSLDESSRGVDLPDFALEANEEPPSSLYHHAKEVRQKGSDTWILVVLIILLALGVLAGWLFFYNGMDTVRSFYNNNIHGKYIYKETVKKQEPAKKPEPVKKQELEPVKEPEPVKQTEPVQQIVEPAPVIQAPVTAPEQRPQQTGKKRSPAPVASYKVPTTIPREGVNYRIRWGDTLWDIAEAFYRNPWLYPRIAKYNNIRNPNLIISGRTIRIPPRN
ncbi:MAG: LysM peptidoglycan-binding domain-containing protein [Brevinematales bacterium]|nr:LysM peptidoglycan-binding domain-containing protein [Brevinematales bacterium]